MVWKEIPVWNIYKLKHSKIIIFTIFSKCDIENSVQVYGCIILLSENKKIENKYLKNFKLLYGILKI